MDKTQTLAIEMLALLLNQWVLGRLRFLALAGLLARLDALLDLLGAVHEPVRLVARFSPPRTTGSWTLRSRPFTPSVALHPVGETQDRTQYRWLALRSRTAA